MTGESTDEYLRTGVHLGDLMVSALHRHADRPVLQIGDTELTGRQMAEAISRYVQAFEGVGAGVESGSGPAVGLLALNRPEVLLVIGAGQTRGWRRTALHPLGSLDDHAYVLNDAGVRTLVIDPNPMFVERAAALLEKVPALTQILTLGPVPPELSEVGVDIVAEAEKYRAQPLTAALLPPDHVVSVTYTGGTTGRPKGVIGTAQAMATMTSIQLAEWEWPDRPRFLMCTPLSHAGAAFFVPTLMTGGSMVVLGRFDPAQVLETIEREQITATMLVPSMLYALLDHPDSHTRDLSSLQTVYYGASAINPVRLAEAIDRFGPVFAQYYGQSEAPMAISYLRTDEHTPERLGSCGRPSSFLRTALLDDQGRPVPQGEPGEICVSGPLLAGGYLGLPEQTAEAFRDGWLHTGDVAREDAEGFWYIVDRTKDMIVTGGFNVFPREVEDVVAAHPAVAQVGVIGVPDDKWGEAVTAVVVLRTPADSGPGESAGGESVLAEAEVAAQIQQAVKEAKGAVHSPKTVIFTDQLPLTALGKPDKKALRARYA
ncbi:putative fatty-acid--CoA ligase [Gordonia hirsuta DSM 44140 = NBRC 16056]|uniref:Putative fatty-acid--CoA ligase n=1 Tax=Gordonia hirsuta DSM 44140 = NBRC 16056 TaxID=1121927 RepID=L7LAG3_9ACTN|nr:putative fatty-acid--CoA ligase [Gordonia hirsuta DSM 44140 = NBRC 16056]